MPPHCFTCKIARPSNTPHIQIVYASLEKSLIDIMEEDDDLMLLNFAAPASENPVQPSKKQQRSQKWTEKRQFKVLCACNMIDFKNHPPSCRPNLPPDDIPSPPPIPFFSSPPFHRNKNKGIQIPPSPMAPPSSNPPHHQNSRDTPYLHEQHPLPHHHQTPLSPLTLIPLILLTTKKVRKLSLLPINVSLTILLEMMCQNPPKE
jgi:hypothetical protein